VRSFSKLLSMILLCFAQYYSVFLLPITTLYVAKSASQSVEGREGWKGGEKGGKRQKGQGIRQKGGTLE